MPPTSTFPKRKTRPAAETVVPASRRLRVVLSQSEIVALAELRAKLQAQAIGSSITDSDVVRHAIDFANRHHGAQS